MSKTLTQLSLVNLEILIDDKLKWTDQLDMFTKTLLNTQAYLREQVLYKNS